MEIIGVKDVSGVRIVEFEFDDKSYTLMSWIVLPKEFWKTPMRHWAIAKGRDLKPNPKEISDWVTGPHPAPLSYYTIQGCLRMTIPEFGRLESGAKRQL